MRLALVSKFMFMSASQKKKNFIFFTYISFVVVFCCYGCFYESEYGPGPFASLYY